MFDTIDTNADPKMSPIELITKYTYTPVLPNDGFVPKLPHYGKIVARSQPESGSEECAEMYEKYPKLKLPDGRIQSLRSQPESGYEGDMDFYIAMDQFCKKSGNDLRWQGLHLCIKVCKMYNSKSNSQTKTWFIFRTTRNKFAFLGQLINICLTQLIPMQMARYPQMS